MFKVFLLIIGIIYYIYRYRSNFLLPVFARDFSSFMGLQGSGKTTIATFLSWYWNKKGFTVYANFPCPDTYQYEVNELGVYDLIEKWDYEKGKVIAPFLSQANGERDKLDNVASRGASTLSPDELGKIFQSRRVVLLLDEAGIDLSNRKFMEKGLKGIREENRKWWKLRRHYGCKHVYIFSQAFDYDVTLRRLCSKQFVIAKHGEYTKIIPLVPKLGVSDDGTTAVFKLEVGKICLWFDRRPYYDMFDSYYAPELPVKQFEYIPPSNRPKNSPIWEVFYKMVDKYINEIKYLVENGYYGDFETGEKTAGLLCAGEKTAGTEALV